MQFKLTHLIFSNNNTVYGSFYQYNAYTRSITNDISSFASESAAESNLEYRNLTFTNNLVALEHVTDVQIGNLIDNGAYKSQDVIFNLPVSDIIDYSQVLSDINSNLTSLNTNIVNKNNQSDIVSCLQDIFMYTASDTNNKVSAMKCENVTVHNETYLKSVNVIYQMRKLINCFSSLDRDFNQPVDNSNKEIFNISKKLSLSVPSDSGALTNYSIKNLLLALFRTISNTDYLNNASANSFLKQFSDKLANSNDFHTISQAIDLISTAIAQTNNTLTNTNTDLGNIATNINSIQSNPLIEVNIDVPYEVKNLTKKDTEY